MTNPFTSPDVGGVITRYGTAIVGAVLATLLVAGLIDQATADEIQRSIPEVIKAFGAVATIVVPIYAAWTKSRSEKAEAAAKAVDKGIAEGDITKSTPISIQTPEGKPDLPVAQPK